MRGPSFALGPSKPRPQELAPPQVTIWEFMEGRHPAQA